MAKKNKNRRRHSLPKYKTLTRNTRQLASPKTQGLRFSENEPLSEFSQLPVVKKTKVRKERTRRSEKQQQGIKNLALIIQPVKVDTSEPVKRVCNRRQERKEIIHAFNKSGKAGQRKPNNQTRDTKC